MQAIGNAQAAVMVDAPKNTNGLDDKYKIPLVFMRETAIFGDRRPEKHEWLQHVELYRAIGRNIDVSHITGLQRVRGFWRIYLDNIEDKVTLMTEGVPLRGKSIPILNTNPDRLDGEATVKVRVKNIPLSVDDGLIKRTITLKGADVISLFREKLRVDNKLTNCETGDRILIIKASSLGEPLPTLMTFGKFTGRVLHQGQQNRDQNRTLKCSKCLQDGHNFRNCPNDWICTICAESGHKRADCPAEEKEEEKEEEKDESQPESDADSQASGDDILGASGDDNLDEQPSAKNPTLNRSGLNDSRIPVIGKPIKRAVRAADRGRQQSITEYVTPKKGTHVNPSNRSPPTPAEDLHDKSVKKNTTKKHKHSK